MRIDHDRLTNSQVFKLLHRGVIRFAGNKKLKIYGTLHCKQGKKMKRENRTFFTTEESAINLGYRPCGKCMKEKYNLWKREKGLF